MLGEAILNVIDTLDIIKGCVTGPAFFIAPQYIVTYRSYAQLKRRILKMVLKIEEGEDY